MPSRRFIVANASRISRDCLLDHLLLLLWLLLNLMLVETLLWSALLLDFLGFGSDYLSFLLYNLSCRLLRSLCYILRCFFFG